MTLVHPWMLHFFWILPLAAFALLVQSRLKRKTLEQLADEELLLRLAPKSQKERLFLKGTLLLLSLGAVIFALAGPRWGSHYQEVSQKGVDIIILLDVSPSMMVEDVKPHRLERARREIVDLLKVIQGDRVGLVAFSGAAFVQCPLTLDYAALEMFLSDLSTDLIPVPGTDMGAAIHSGLAAFDFKIKTDKVMLLISDGEDNENRGLAAAHSAAEKGVKIFVFGIGERSGGPIPAGGEKGGFKKDPAGNLVLSKLDEAALETIASASGGIYTRAVTGDMDLDILYFDGIKKRTESQTLKTGKIKVYEERFTFFALGAFLFLLLEGLIDENDARKTGRMYCLIILCSMYGFAQFALPGDASAAESADELYRQGRFEEAEKAYTRLDMDYPRDIRYRFNRGCAAYQNERSKEAAAAFASVLKRADDAGLRFKAAYNSGNAAFKQGDFETAAAFYKKSIILNPASRDARYNLEMALKALEKAKKENAQPTKSESKEKAFQKEDRAEDDKEGKGSAKNAQEDRADKTDVKSRQETENKGRSDSEPEKETDRKESLETAKREKSSESRSEKLSGELKPLKDLPGPGEKREGRGISSSNMDKNKAKALLDNIKENRSRFLHFLMPVEKRQKMPSGKDW